MLSAVTTNCAHCYALRQENCFCFIRKEFYFEYGITVGEVTKKCCNKYQEIVWLLSRHFLIKITWRIAKTINKISMKWEKITAFKVIPVSRWNKYCAERLCGIDEENKRALKIKLAKVIKRITQIKISVVRKITGNRNTAEMRFREERIPVKIIERRNHVRNCNLKAGNSEIWKFYFISDDLNCETWLGLKSHSNTKN